MKKFLRKNNGITLIALVITIIILLILAGVVIASLTGDNGLLNRAVQARNGTILAETKEKIRLSAMDSYVEGNGSITYGSLINSLNRHFKGNGTEEDYYEIVEGDNTTSTWKVRVHTSVGDVDEIIDGKVAPTDSYQWKIVADKDNSGTISVFDEVAPVIESIKDEHFIVLDISNQEVILMAKLCVDPTSNSQSTNAAGITFNDAYDTGSEGKQWVMEEGTLKSKELVEVSTDSSTPVFSEVIEYYGNNELGTAVGDGRVTRNYEQRLINAGLTLFNIR